jgi:hypothetical protein
MTPDELEQIQTACHEWLRQPGTSQGSRMTIPAPGAISSELHVEVRSILTFDNVLIRSVVDCITGVCYTKLIGPYGETGDFIDTPFEMVATATRPEPKNQSPARDAELGKSTERVDESVECGDGSGGAYERPIPLIETHDINGEPRPKYLLYTNGKLLGYSRLERTDADGDRRGRFYPIEDYYDYAAIFEEMVTTENEVLEINLQEAYGIEADPDAAAIRNKFNDLSARIEALELYLSDEDGQRIDAAQIKLEDRARYYGDEAERWLYVALR